MHQMGDFLVISLTSVADLQRDGVLVIIIIHNIRSRELP
jgi:hypothetical protein